MACLVQDHSKVKFLEGLIMATLAYVTLGFFLIIVYRVYLLFS